MFSDFYEKYGEILNDAKKKAQELLKEVEEVFGEFSLHAEECYDDNNYYTRYNVSIHGFDDAEIGFISDEYLIEYATQIIKLKNKNPDATIEDIDDEIGAMEIHDRHGFIEMILNAHAQSKKTPEEIINLLSTAVCAIPEEVIRELKLEDC